MTDQLVIRPGAVASSRPRSSVRGLAALGAAWLALGSLAIATLHLLPEAGDMNPLSEPISKYALSSAGWLFDTGVIILALGLGAVISALVLGRKLPPSSAAFVALSICCLGLVVLVIFPDETSGRTFTAVGWTHWTAAMIAFGGLPVAPVLIARHHRPDAGCSRLPAAARALSLTAGVGFIMLLVGSILEVVTVLPVWKIGGIVERFLGAAEIAAALVLAVWAWRGCGCTHRRSDARALAEPAAM